MSAKAPNAAIIAAAVRGQPRAAAVQYFNWGKQA